MISKATRRNTLLFIGFFLLAGIANALSRVSAPSAPAALMTGVNYMIYIGMLLFWTQSVRTRLLPSRARNCVTAAAVLMLFYQLVRIFKYRIAYDLPVIRYSVYLYSVPMAMIPALLWMTSLWIRKGSGGSAPKIRLVLVPGILLSLIFLTNDLHHWVYRPLTDPELFAVDTGTYVYGPCFYLLYAWIVFSLAAGILPLYREAGRRASKGILPLTAIILIWVVSVLLSLLVFDRSNSIRMYNIPEAHTFGMLGVFEVCIRSRLIPYNENYSGFFRQLQMPSLITDQELRTVYRSETGLSASEDELRAALEAPVYPEPDRKLSGRRIRAGCIFWTEDESAVHLAQERLSEANKMIEEENSLLREETEQKEKDAYLRSRHRIYHEIAAELYPCQQRIERILQRMKPGSADFRENIALVSVLNAYLKRKTNLLLLASEKETLPSDELMLCLRESADYLTLAGLQTTVHSGLEKNCTTVWIVSAYDAFECLAEQLMGNASSMMVSLNDQGLLLAAETDFRPDPGRVSAPVRLRQADGILYMEILLQKEDDQP